jgi:O-antigen/teichoic acid export membrane protein
MEGYDGRDNYTGGDANRAMKPRKSESFVRGAMILSLAALIARLLGAFYKPIVSRIFAPYDGHNGATGIGLTQIPLATYNVIFSFTSVGLNVGISKLVAERMAVGDVRGARRVFRLSLTIMAVLGFSASLGLWFGAPYLAGLIGKDATDTIPGFRATAPALFIVSIMAAYRGLFQGFQQMAPNAYSQIIEQVVRVGSGILLTYIFVKRSVPLGAAGFNFGDVLGALAGLTYLLLLVRATSSNMWRVSEEAATLEPPSIPQDDGNPWVLIRRIFAVAAPIVVAGAVVPLMMWSDTFFVFRGLAQVGISGDDAQASYGMLTNAFMVVYLPEVFTSALYTSILPSIANSVARGMFDDVRRRAIQAFRLTFLLAIPAQVGLYVLATDLYHLLYRDFLGGSVMAAIAWATTFIMIQKTSAGVLQGTGRINLTLRNFMIGAVLKISLTAWWTSLWGINGAAYATVVGFGVAALLNLIYVEIYIGRTLQTRSMILKPLGSALVMAGVIALLRRPLAAYSHHPTINTFLLIGIGGVAYLVALVVLRGIKREELETIPKVGRPLVTLLQRTHLLR